MIQDKLKSELSSFLEGIYNIRIKESDFEVTRSDRKEHGNYSTNIAFKLAKELKKKPQEIAEEIKRQFDKGAWGVALVAKIETVNGFINIFLPVERYQEVLREILEEGQEFGNSTLFKDKKVQVEFISANPTGPFTLANGRGGFSGDALANVFSKAGANVTREYYVNDGGNQVRLLGNSILAALGYIEEAEEFYKGEYISEWANSNKAIVAEHKEDPFELGQIAAEWILENYNKPSTEKVGIHFDNWFSENEMIKRGEVDEAIAKFTKYGQTYEKDGALWMKTTDFGDDKDRVLVKADGEKTYYANDVAYHFDKFYKRNFDLVVNFWGADHHGYVSRMLAAVEAMGCPGHLKIVIFQLVKLIKDGKEFKMSKRKGTYVTMDDLLEMISNNTVSTSAQAMRDASDVARFFFLMRSFNTHMDFDLDLAREQTDKNPVFYVKYAHARLCGILRNAKGLNLPKADLAKIIEEAEIELLDELSNLPGVIESILLVNDYPVHILTYYAIEIAKKFHAFYDKCRVIDESDLELTAARLELVRATQIVLGIVMQDLIGIEAPEKM